MKSACCSLSSTSSGRTNTHFQRLEEIRVPVRGRSGDKISIYKDDVRFNERVDAEAVSG